MNSALLITAIVAIIAGCIPIAIIAIRKHKIEKAAAEKLAKEKENERKKNETKEKMETGNAAHDFNNSIDILHNLAKRK